MPGVGGGKSSGAFSLIVARVAIIFQVLLFFFQNVRGRRMSHTFSFFLSKRI